MRQEKHFEQISVIIPIYNVEPYLKKCVDSVLAQTYENIEVILVDDGSTDGCPAICDAYLQEDSRVKVIHKENGGLSSARNAGLNIAKGELISFVDSDDFIEPGMLETMYEALSSSHADMAVCDYRKVDSLGNELSQRPEVVTRDEVLDEAAYWKKVYEPHAMRYVVAWSKLYRRRLWEKTRYPEGKINEDAYVLHELVHACGKIAIVSYVGYNYTVREGSIMSSKMKKANFDLLDAWFLRIAYFQREGKLEEIQKQLSECCVELLARYHLCNTKAEKEQFHKYFQEYKSLYNQAKREIRMPIKERIKTIGCEFFPGWMNLVTRWVFRHMGVR